MSLKVPENSAGGFEATLVTFRKGRARIRRVTLVEGARPLSFRQTEEAFVCNVPPRDAAMADLPYCLKLEGSMETFND